MRHYLRIMGNVNNDNLGMVGAVRQQALKFSDLARAEKHGKREDESSQRRRVRDDGPLIYGSIDLAAARARHMDGVKQSGRTACIHALVQFPTGLIDGTDPDQQLKMLHHTVRFLNKFHGGDAVFAARLDRDEKGRHTVDAFLLPKYDYRYKDGRIVKKASVSKFSKEHARAMYHKTDKKTGKPILDPRTGKPIPRDDTRAQGSALQSAFFEYLRDEMGLDRVMPPQRKKFTVMDRLEPEEYGLLKDRQRFRELAQNFSKADKIARTRNKRCAEENSHEAKSLELKNAALSAERKHFTEERLAFEKFAAQRLATMEEREANLRRSAKTVRNAIISSGLGVSRSLNKILDQAFESQDVR
ncbi:hypothetical protein [Qingshengfaniella alkalisoli]|uniref:Mobilization protein n=1 Tax=Qingshengfaniella alkalisoli TaxID=2599296 RepID=A0A5B8J4U4_9RHOB|nr:hypothetical protein [Qingshengfaniella alkalisoli]QDY69310.1 hypothetical protein FPZ52_06485 [Qingshengfaniella alkalisoli]